MRFAGWDAEDFEVFAIPDFAGRMAEIRARVRPKLLALGDDLTPAIEAEVGLPTFRHVAQHMRRRVNPPEETWVAYTRDKKGYKRWTHFRIAVSAAGLRVTVFVEDDADDKPGFGAQLQSGAEEILGALGPGAPVLWYTLDSGGPVEHAAITDAALRDLGASLQRLKTAKFQAGVSLPRDEAVRLSPAEFEAWALKQVRLLKPLYLAAARPENGAGG